MLAAFKNDFETGCGQSRQDCDQGSQKLATPRPELYGCHCRIERLRSNCRVDSRDSCARSDKQLIRKRNNPKLAWMVRFFLSVCPTVKGSTWRTKKLAFYGIDCIRRPQILRQDRHLHNRQNFTNRQRLTLPISYPGGERCCPCSQFHFWSSNAFSY